MFNNMGLGEPKMPTPEELARIQKERDKVIKGAIDGGAQISFTEQQIRDIKGEHEGELFPDLAAYFRKNKEVIFDGTKIKDYIDTEVVKVRQKMCYEDRGSIWSDKGNTKGDIFTWVYLDKDLNVCRVTIDPSKIISIKNHFPELSDQKKSEWDKAVNYDERGIVEGESLTRNRRFREIMEAELVTAGFTFLGGKPLWLDSFISRTTNRESEERKRLEAEKIKDARKNFDL
jgi:hypothetical protein